jgi:hypothetical protein
MTDGLFIILCAVAVVLTGVIWIQARRIRQLQRKVDVHAEALRMLAQPIHVELPPEPPTKPDLKLLKGGMVAFSAATSGTISYLHKHGASSSAIAAGAVAAVLSGILVFTGVGRRAPSAMRPPELPALSPPASAPLSPSTAPVPVPASRSASPSARLASGAVPAAAVQRPSPHPSTTAPPVQRTTAAPSPVRSQVRPSPSTPQPSSCPVGLSLRFDPLLLLDVCA